MVVFDPLPNVTLHPPRLSTAYKRRLAGEFASIVPFTLFVRGLKSVVKDESMKFLHIVVQITIQK